ncbi:hypothetical protein [Maritalea sp.]|uniref:hypothetical protein n=1 Tax=Maritalea sp. TaxID=2003361 RepID=UPI003EF45A62
MNYAEARSKIQTGDLLAWRGNGFWSWLIRHTTGGAHTHVGVAWWFRKRLFVLEAKEGVGVQLRALSNTGSFDWLPTNINWSIDLECFAFSHLGKRYSYLEAVGAGLGFTVQNDEFICSEYAAELFRRADRLNGLKVKSPTPTGLVQYWLGQGVSLRAILN